MTTLILIAAIISWTFGFLTGRIAGIMKAEEDERRKKDAVH